LDGHNHATDSPLAQLLNSSELASAEEDLGQTEADQVSLDLFGFLGHKEIDQLLCSNLGIGSGGLGSGLQKVVALEELCIDNTVRETFPGNTNTLKKKIKVNKNK